MPRKTSSAAGTRRHAITAETVSLSASTDKAIEDTTRKTDRTSLDHVLVHHSVSETGDRSFIGKPIRDRIRTITRCLNDNVFATVRGPSNRLEHVEDVVGERCARSMGPLTPDRPREVRDAGTPTVRILVGECDVLEAVVVTDSDGPLEMIWIREADGPLRAVEFVGRRGEFRSLDVETQQEVCYRPVLELDDGGFVRRDRDVDGFPPSGLACDRPFGERRGDGTGHTLDGADEGDESGDVVRPHIEERPAALVVVKIRVRVPRLVARGGPDCRRAERVADTTLVDERSTRLETSPEDGVGGRPDVEPFTACRFEDDLAVGDRSGEGFLDVDVFPGLEDLSARFGVDRRRREVDDQVGGRIEESIDIVSLDTMLVRSRGRRVGIDIPAGDDLELVETVVRGEVGVADGATAEDADGYWSHLTLNRRRMLV